MTINARHRKHFKSGACYEYAPLQWDTPSRSWRAMLAAVKADVQSKATAVLTRPAYFQPSESRFSRIVRSIGNLLMGRRLAAA